MTIALDDITAVILAGGQGRRMGGKDKGLLPWQGKTLVEALIEKLRRQSLGIMINANRNRDRYRQFGLPVVGDRLDDYQGPLAGFASAMGEADTDFILTLPCDSPFLADDYAARFVEAQAASNSPVVVADDGERLQPVHALIGTALLPELERFLDSGERKIDRWYAQHDYARADFSDCADMFRNINTPEDQQSINACS